MDVAPNIFSLIGNTPLVRLPRLCAGYQATVVAKLEMLNPGGSVKDRIGTGMIEAAERAGLLGPGGTLVEPTSGNTGVGLAMVAAVKGYRMIFVMPDKMSAEKIALLKAYGAEVVITPTSVPRESPESYYQVADRLAREIPGAFQPNQYFNQANPQAHYDTTGPELWRQTEGQITTLVASVGTGGTITGAGRYLKEQDPRVRVVGADPEESILSGGVEHPYKTEGIGEDFFPGTFDPAVIDQWVRVSDKNSLLTARRLTREEGILSGGSAGTAMWAALEVARDEPAGSLVVVLLPDTGRNYLSKIYNDDWMRQNGFLEPAAETTRVGQVLAGRHGHVPTMVTVRASEQVGRAIDLLQEYGISQMPVAARAEATDVAELLGSIQERNLLDRVFRNPAIIEAPVQEVMDPPLPIVDAGATVNEVFSLLSGDASAIVVVQGTAPRGVVTRSDLLDFMAHQARRSQ